MKNLLLVTEKPSIARKTRIAFSTAKKYKFKTIKGKTRYNSIFETTIDSDLEFVIEKTESSQQQINLHSGDKIRITSVLGYIASFNYPPPFDKATNWNESDPIDLVDLTAVEIPINSKLTDQLIELGKETDYLVLGTDLDSAGEAIGAQIKRYVEKETKKKVITSRMRFTSTTVPSIIRAFEQQHILDEQLIKSVDSLRRQDLRMGASLTRFLTVGVQEYGQNRLISYGPCQSSVVWIITNRFLERQSFLPEPYWLLQAKFLTIEPLKSSETKSKRKKKTKKRRKATKRKSKKKKVTTGEIEPFVFNWINNPITDSNKCDEILNKIENIREGQFVGQTESIEVIDRPKPLDTDTLEADCSRLFRVSPKLIADIAEKLYNNSFITYPRTESSYYLFKDLTPICNKFLEHPVFQDDVKNCLKEGNPKNPSKGRFTKDHEPIMPVKSVTEKEISTTLKRSDFENNLAWRVYEYIVRRFFATIHQDAELEITSTNITVLDYEFLHKAKTLAKLGFLSVYPYRKIKENSIPPISIDKKIPITLNKEEKHTTPPNLWTESLLIREMSRLNIGTDATRSQHIATVIDRGFAKILRGSRALIPTDIGIAFYQIFIKYAEKLILPQIRETVEEWTLNIRTGDMTSLMVDENVIKLTKQSLINLKKEKRKIFPILSDGIKISTKEGVSFGSCIKCESDLILKSTSKGKRYLICSNAECKQSYPAPRKGDLILLPEHCRACNLYPIQVGSGTKSWIFCPSCWVNRVDPEGLMFCSRCEYENCPYSKINRNYKTKQEKGRLGSCPNCLKGEIVLYFEEWKSIVECENCQTQWKAPNIRAGTSIEVDGPCKLCNLSTLLIKRKNKSPYNMCPICSLLCFQCIHRCYG
ncbi:MAG: DNA topoisomerase [Candidatus Hodarchaeales archaeon]|jgi:DNA topoisomerase IA